MALTVGMETNYGISISSGHAVIREFALLKHITPEDGVKHFDLHYSGAVWYDEEKYTSGKAAMVGFNYTFALDVTNEADQHNILKQCYNHLKTQDGFTDGVDA